MKTALTALAVFAGCTAVRLGLDPSACRGTDHLNGHVRLKALWNKGAAFGLPIPAEILPLASAGALGALWAAGPRTCPVGAGLIQGGGLSNLYERVRLGKVYDYLQFPKAPGPLRRYVFNLADLAVLTGGVLCLREGV